MTKYCGVISVGGTTGGGYVATVNTDQGTGQVYESNQVPIAVTLVSFKIGETFFRKIRVCQQFVSGFIHQGDNACIYVYKQMGIIDVIIGVKSSQYPSYSISYSRMLLMIFANFVFGSLICFIPAHILFGWISSKLAMLGMLALPAYGSWTLYEAYQEMEADFK